MDNNETDEQEESKPSFRIRFTIGNNKNTNNLRECSSKNSDNNCQNLCNANYCDQFSSNDCQEHVYNHIIEIETNEKTNQTTARTIETNKLQNNNTTNKKKLFEFVEPQNHKSSLIVNLTTDSSYSSENQFSRESHLFISPDLNQSSPPSPIELNLLSETNSCENIFNNTSDNIKSSYTLSKQTPAAFDDAMSNSCNFINSWMSASRRRSASVTRPSSSSNKDLLLIKNNETSDDLNTTTNDVVSNRRASSSNDLPSSNANNKLLLSSNSGNNLAVGVSTETICGIDVTQTNKNPFSIRKQASSDDNNRKEADKLVIKRHSEMIQPIEISISTDDEFDCELLDQQDYYPTDDCDGQPINLSDILAIDMDSLRLQDECKNLEDQVEYMERRVDELERKRFGDDVSRTLVENVLKQRRRLRELEFQIYKLSLDSEVSDKLSHDGALVSPSGDCLTHTSQCFLDQTQMYPGCIQKHDNNRASGRFGSKLKPGQENTADILDAIPPSGSLQHKQYLNRASTGTDTSEYSQLPLFDLHRHHLPSLHNDNQSPKYGSEESQSPMFKEIDHHHNNRRHNRKERHHHHHHHNKSPARHQHQDQLRWPQQREQPGNFYVQLVDQKVKNTSSENRVHHHYQQRSSPVRPDHFKDEFRTNHNVNNISQDSSSTASSSSPHS